MASSVTKEGAMYDRYEPHVPSRAEIVVGKIADTWRRWRDQRELARFVHLYPTEANRLARDLGVDEVALLKIAAHSGETPTLLNRRLRLLGIDPAHLRRSEPAVTQDLARCCALCRCKSQCARDLAWHPHSESWRTYCPNSHTLMALRPDGRPAMAC